MQGIAGEGNGFAGFQQDGFAVAGDIDFDMPGIGALLLMEDGALLVAAGNKAAYTRRDGLYLRSPNAHSYEVPGWKDVSVVVQKIHSPSSSGPRPTVVPFRER